MQNGNNPVEQLDAAKVDVQKANELAELVGYFIKRGLLAPAYIKAARSLAFNADRVSRARMADCMSDVLEAQAANKE